MCGIVGAFDLKGRRDFDPAVLSKMAAAVRHRGPDDAAYRAEPGFAMAAQRLAIRDAAGGRQPVADAAGQVWASLNGEIFNYPEMRQALAEKNIPLQTHCDSELLPGMFLLYEDALFSKLRGQFAAAIFDRRERVLLLGRDRIGICPLHYAVADGWLLWASEIKGILASGLVMPEPDLGGIDHIFTLFASGTKRTCFRGIYSIWPGHFLRVQNDALREHRYWDLDFPRRGEEIAARPEALLAELAPLLSDAVSRRLISDGPVANYLSGGLDSTLVLALTAQAKPATLNAFSVGFDTAGVDERKNSRQNAGVFNSHLDVIVPDEAEITAALAQVVEATEAPFMDTANACLLLLARRVSASGFKVALSGEGADEALAGYSWHKIHKMLAALNTRLPRSVYRATAFLSGGGKEPERKTLPEFLSRGKPGIVPVIELLSRARSLLYSDETLAYLRGYNPLTDMDVHNAGAEHWHPLNQALYLEYKIMLPGHLLHGKGDRVAMHSAVETRYPFLDEKFIDFCSRVAPALKLKGFKEKWLLRQLAAGMMPRGVSRLPKMMFKAKPLCQLQKNTAWVDQLLSPEALKTTGYFSGEKVRHEQRIQRQHPAWSPRRFVVDGSFTAMVMTQLWHHTFMRQPLCELPAWSPPESRAMVRLS